MTPEIHLFIIWEKAGTFKETILHRICAEFDVLKVFRIQWSAPLFSRNLSRFYGQNLPPGCNKEESCGTGPFTVVVVYDHWPNYAIRQTTRGSTLVNSRTFDLKAFFRSPAGGGVPIHASDTSREASHDLTMLFGMGPFRFSEIYPGKWDGEVIPLRQDVVGAKGWRSIDELFFVLNETLDYVVLRNFECLPDQYLMESHGDIDLLVGNYAEACLITNAIPVNNEPHRVYNTVTIAGESIPFDFRYVGDGYYDETWQRRILESRILSDKGFYMPDPGNYFYSLLYHAAVHKPIISADYIPRLTMLGMAVYIQLEPQFFEDSRKLRAFLRGYLRQYGYKFTPPSDQSVYFNTAIACTFSERVRYRFSPKEYSLPSLFDGKKELSSNGVPAGGNSQVLASLRQCHDVGSASAEVQALVGGSLSEYLLSPARANLLRFIHFSPGQRVLEVGCGGGSITRFLGEAGAEVIAVEFSPAKAAIAAERCRDLPNVTILCSDLTDFRDDKKFDYVMLVGTLGYMSAYISSGDDPVVAALQWTQPFLKGNGTLILAAENQLGLKYFNGCSEDYTGIPYFGINSLYGNGDPATFGRRILEDKLRKAGFADLEFFFPFPDYKFPKLILSEAALRDERLNLADLLIHNTGTDYPETHQRAFAEDMAWRTVIDNGLVADLSNSFLILAKVSGAVCPAVDWLAKLYSPGQRYPQYQVESTIEVNGHANLEVLKRKIFPEVEATSNWLSHVVENSSYHFGNLLIGRIRRAMAKEAGLDELASCFVPWLEFLLAHAQRHESGEHLLPNDFVDCIPANLVENQSGELQYFDREWVSRKPIPIAWVIIRGICNSLVGCVENRSLNEVSYSQLVKQIAQQAGVELTENDFTVAALHEDRLVSDCFFDASSRPRLKEYLNGKLHLVSRLSGNIPELRRSLAWHEAECIRIKSTVSWQITKPLRFVSFLWRQVKRRCRLDGCA